jgi:hypothetical protein
MFSIALLGLVIIDMALLAYAAKMWLQNRSNNALLMQTVLLLLLWFDVLTVAIGGWMGDTELLRTMSRIRYVWFYLTMPLLLIAVGALARQANFAWAQPKWVMGLICVVAVALLIREVPPALMVEYQTACFADTLRHVYRVPVGQACVPGQEGMGTSGSPLAIMIIFPAVTLMGILLWVRRKWPWLGVSALAFMGGTAIPASIVGPFMTYPLDTLMTAAFVFAALKFPPKGPDLHTS